MKLWTRISKLGLKSTTLTLDKRSIILTNQLNTILLIVFTILVIVTRTIGIIEKNQVGMGTYRSVFIVILSCVIILLSYKEYHKASRFLLIYFPPILLFIVPTMVGFIEEESFVYYPYAIISLSIIPQLLIIPQKEKKFFYISITYYFAIMLITIFIINAIGKDFKIAPIIRSFYVWYTIIPIALFVFTFYAIYYLRSINLIFEKEIKRKNKILDLQNETLKSTIKELNKTQEKLIHSEKMAALGNITSGIAHEINNPLNHIAGGSFLILEELENSNSNKSNIDKEAIVKANEMIESGINRATRVVQLLSVFTQNSDCLKDFYNLNQIIDSTLCFVNTKIEGLIKIKKEYQFNGMVHVFQDQIHKCLLSVFENAIEAIDINTKKGLIEIKTYVQDSNVIIEIWNSESTIIDKDLLRVFNPFFTTKSHKMNPGLGLTVAYNILQEHNGDITITNKNGGVKVTITLPYSEEKT